MLVRHAEIERRYQHAFGGRIDMHLSPRGRAQARTLAEFLHGKPIAAIYSSPMKRVQQTLAPFLHNGAPAQTILPGLQEVDFGDWSGHNWNQVREKFGVHPYDWLDEIELGAVPNGENGVIRMILAILLNLPLPKTNLFEIEYTSVTQVVLHAELNEVELLNFTPWRDWRR